MNVNLKMSVKLIMLLKVLITRALIFVYVFEVNLLLFNLFILCCNKINFTKVEEERDL